jgi:outer membrane protein TolC
MKPPAREFLRVRSWPNAALLAFVGLGLSGCATFGNDGSSETVQSRKREAVPAQPTARTDAVVANAAVKELLGKPLTPDAAVEVAVLNNSGLRASFARLDITEPDLVRTARVSGSEAQGSVSTLLSKLLSLLRMPQGQMTASREFEPAHLELASDIVRLAGDARKAWVLAVAAQESVNYFEQARMAAEASAELAGRMAQVGNFSKLAHMREQAFYADATAQLAKARLVATIERERLTRLLGLASPDIDYQLPDRLPELPASPVEATQLALEQRLDVRLAGNNIVGRSAPVAFIAPSEARESYQAYRTAYDIARHYRDEIVPLRKRIAEENMLRYNGMLISVFELLADAREQIVSVSGYLDALRDFWLAQTDLDVALNGGSRNGGPRARAPTMPAGGSAGGH